MSTKSTEFETGALLAFDRFWRWLQQHNNCILRAGTQEAWLYDQDDLHWFLYDEPGGRRGVQLMRGKQVLGEIALASQDILYVEVMPSSEADGQFEFQLLGGPEGDMYALYHFMLSHSFDEQASDRLATH